MQRKNTKFVHGRTDRKQCFLVGGDCAIDDDRTFVANMTHPDVSTYDLWSVHACVICSYNVNVRGLFLCNFSFLPLAIATLATVRVQQ